MSSVMISTHALFLLPVSLNKLFLSVNSCRKIQVALEEEVSKARYDSVARVLNSVGA